MSILANIPLTAALLSGARTFTPASLFAAGEVGVWYDPSDMTTLFQDSAGTTPVTAVEQPVGLIQDKSGRGNHATQSTSASRPVLSARYNLLTYTEQFDNAAWSKFRCTVAADNQTAPDGTVTVDRLNCDTTASGGFFAWRTASTVTVPSGTDIKLSIVSKKGSRNQCRIDYGADSASNNGAFAYFNLDTGAYVSSGTYGSGVSVVGTPTISSLGSGYYRMTLVVNSNTTTANPIFYPSITSSSDFSCTSGVDYGYAWGADLRVSNDGTGLPAYQRVVQGIPTTTNPAVTGTADYDTAGFPYYLRWDGVDDFMSTGAIDLSGTDKVTVFTGVRKLSDATTPGFLDYGPAWASLTGSFGVYAPSYRASLPATKYAVALKGSTGTRDADYATYTAPITNVLAVSFDIGAAAASEIAMRINGATVTANSIGGDAGGGNFGSTHKLQIGRYSTNDNYWNGRLYGLIVRGASSTDNQIADTERWLNGRTRGY